METSAIKIVIVTTDFSDRARGAYGPAGDLARWTGADVHLVHEAPILPRLYYPLENAGAPVRDYHRHLEQSLEVEAKHEGFAGARVQSRLLTSASATPTILEYAEATDSALLVTSTHGRTGLDHALLGSFAERLLRHASVPVYTCTARSKTAPVVPPRSVLVPLDFSDNSTAVLPQVALLSGASGTRFLFLEVVETEAHVFDAVEDEGIQLYADLRAALLQAPELARERFRAFREKHLEGVDATFEVVEGKAHHEIVEAAAARACDLILMATHGWTGLDRFLIGSVAEKVVRHASCPVLTVRPPRAKGAAGKWAGSQEPRRGSKRR